MTSEMKTIQGRIETLKAQYDEELTWGVRWDNENLPVGHIFENSRTWIDGTPTDDTLKGACAIRDEDLHFVTAHNFYLGVPYIVCGYKVGYGEDDGEVILSECEIMEVA